LNIYVLTTISLLVIDMVTSEEGLTMKQNIFDNETFFNGYRELRENENNGNILIEKPCIFSLLPDLTNKSILDMGCGYGENCKEFVKLGASFVQGIDISNKMLEIAMQENSDEKIIYNNVCLEDIQHFESKFDVIISSLAVHYVKDFNKLAHDVSNLLKNNGVFIFSQEHPLTTAPINGAEWIKDNDGNKMQYCLSDYSLSGERAVSWFVDNVTKYHRTFSDIINSLINNGFYIDSIAEPIPSGEIINRLPKYKSHYHKPNYLAIKTLKKPTV